LIAAEQQSSGITETPRSKTETPLTRPAAAATTTLAHTWLKAWPAKELVVTKAKTKLGKAPNKNQSQQFLIYHL